MKATTNDWARINVNALRHPKVLGLDPEQTLEWIAAILYSVEHETDGRVPLEIFDGPEVVPALIDAGLLEEIDGSLWLHDFGEYQPTREEREEKRRINRERQRRWREEHLGNELVTRDETRDSSTSTSTSPSLGFEVGSSPRGEGSNGSGPARKPTHRIHDYSDSFERFWSVYPAKRDKWPAAVAYTAALDRASEQEIIAGAERYRDDPRRDPDKTKNAQGWLNGDRWLDESEPSRNSKPDWRADAIRGITA